jgi:hypothetical protein
METNIPNLASDTNLSDKDRQDSSLVIAGRLEVFDIDLDDDMYELFISEC